MVLEDEEVVHKRHGAQKQTKMVQTVEAIVHRFDLVIAPESDSCGFCGRVKQIS